MSLGLVTALGVATPAEAAGNAVRKGTMRLSAERLAGIGARVNDPATFYMNLLTSYAGQGELQYPRTAFDYFIIDGLSIGGSVGFGFDSNSENWGLSILPRIGYAFDLTRSIEFWPRGGIGLHFRDFPGGDDSSAVMTIEGMFLWEMVPHALLEFGPFIDASFANAWPIVMGGHAGIAIEF
jgi:hypothetical protein